MDKLALVLLALTLLGCGCGVYYPPEELAAKKKACEDNGMTAVYRTYLDEEGICDIQCGVPAKTN